MENIPRTFWPGSELRKWQKLTKTHIKARTTVCWPLKKISSFKNQPKLVWHRCDKGLNFYEIVPFLFVEARRTVALERVLLCQEIGTQLVFKADKQKEEMLFWESYNDEDDSTRDLLSNCAQLYIDFNSLRFEKDRNDDKDGGQNVRGPWKIWNHCHKIGFPCTQSLTSISE